MGRAAGRAAKRRRHQGRPDVYRPGRERELLAEMEESLVAAASGSTSLPLTDRDVAWDAAAAAKSLSPEQYPKAFFWRDPDRPAEQAGAWKLGFAKDDGGLTAVWKGVTAAAGAVQGARGGVKIPDADVAGVKSKIAAYYRKAAEQYDDDAIKPPWEDASSSAAESLAYAEAGGTDEYEARLAHWDEAFGLVEIKADLTAAFEFVRLTAGDQVWGPEDGFQDLLCDLNELLNPGGQFPSTYWACDVSLDLTRALVSGEGDDFWVAPITLDTDKEPVLAPRSEWVEAEQSWVEANDEMGANRSRSVTAAAEADVQVPDANDTTNGGLRWEAVFVPEGTPTDDGRMFSVGSLTWRDLPLSLMAMTKTDDGHDGAEVAGRIDRVWRDGTTVRAAGVFDSGEFGQEIARMVGDKVLTGLSVDVAVREAELVPRSVALANPDDPTKKADDEEPDDEGDISLEDLLGEDMIFVVTDGVIGAATVCPFPAFAGASISLAASGAVWRVSSQAGFVVTREADCGCAEAEVEVETLAASAAEAGLVPLIPPAEWFEDPGLTEPTPLTITDAGRVYGHAAPWATCHIGLPGGCTVAPRSLTNYSYFLLGEVEVETSEGRARVPAGQITLGTGHANPRLGRERTAEHYDDTGAAAADVNVGEDEHGIWIAGALRPDVSAERVRELSAAKLSGDWRNVDGNLELVALLAVNVPGFPVQRPRALVAYGYQGEPEDEQTVLSLTLAADAATMTYDPNEERDEQGRWAGDGSTGPSDGGDAARARNDVAMARIGESHDVKTFRLSRGEWGVSDPENDRDLGKVSYGASSSGETGWRAQDFLGQDLGFYDSPSEAVRAVSSSR